MRKLFGVGLAAIAALCLLAPAARAGESPLFIFTPVPAPPPALPIPLPTGFLSGPCGLAVDPSGRFYVSDYYHDVVDVYDQNANYNAKGVTGATGYLGQLTGIDSLDGPCQLAFDASGRLYVNDYHRAVLRYGALGSFGSASTITGATSPEETHPTGVDVDRSSGNVYVDQRTYVSVFDESGAPLEEGGEPVHIGEGSLEDGYGVAFSQYPATTGYLYVPDAATNTIKVYDSATPEAGPLEEIDGSGTPNGEFTSLTDAAIAVDRVSGEIYVIDDLQPEYTEKPQAIVYVFAPDGSYEGHLKYLITDALPSGLAVDNSATATQGRVYVTSGNTVPGTIYAYGPGSATTTPFKVAALAPPPPLFESPTLQEQDAGECPGCGKDTVAAATQAAFSPEALAQALPTAKRQQRKARHHRRAHPQRGKSVKRAR